MGSLHLEFDLVDGVSVDQAGFQFALPAGAFETADHRAGRPTVVDQGDAFVTGEYELVFHAGDYFAASGVDLPEPRFVDRVALRFGIADPTSHYHVPLLVSPWAYSTYRGS